MSRLIILTFFSLSFFLSGYNTPQEASINQVKSYQAYLDAEEAGKINWVSWNEAMELMKTEKRKVFVDIYTDWCGWCKQMDKTTFSDPNIVAYANKNYYAVKFNAESKEPLEMGGQVYKYVKSTNSKGKGYHELAVALTKGQLSYPSVVFLNEEAAVIQPIPGYKDAATFEVIMTYFGGNFHQTTPWNKYQKEYIPLKKQQLKAD